MSALLDLFSRQARELTLFLGHYSVFSKGGVLHRDISEGNLMFARRAMIVNGILLDFDNSSDVDEDGNVESSTAQQRTGTAPFMARELLGYVSVPAFIPGHC